MGHDWYGNFALLLFMVLVLKNEPNGEYTERFLNFGSLITAAGILVIMLLISYEIQEGKICLYCTTAHIANVSALAGFFTLKKTTTMIKVCGKPNRLRTRW